MTLSPDEEKMMDSDYLKQLREAHRYELAGAFDTALLKAIGVVMKSALPLAEREALCDEIRKIRR